MRLKWVLADTIVETQDAFLARKQILNVVLVANEIVEEYSKVGKPIVIFKIDFENAYDCGVGFLRLSTKKKFRFVMEKMDSGMSFNRILFSFH